MQPYNLTDLLVPFQQLTPNVALYLPRTSDLRQLVKCNDREQSLPVVHYCMEGASKVRRTQALMIYDFWLTEFQALCAYFGGIGLL